MFGERRGGGEWWLDGGEGKGQGRTVERAREYMRAGRQARTVVGPDAHGAVEGLALLDKRREHLLNVVHLPLEVVLSWIDDTNMDAWGGRERRQSRPTNQPPHLGRTKPLNQMTKRKGQGKREDGPRFRS